MVRYKTNQELIMQLQLCEAMMRSELLEQEERITAPLFYTLFRFCKVSWTFYRVRYSQAYIDKKDHIHGYIEVQVKKIGTLRQEVWEGTRL